MTLNAFSDPGAVRLSVAAIDSGNATWIEIHGEADVSNADQLKAALDNIDLDGAKTVQLHVSELAFVDVAALRALTTFAHHLKQAGRTVITVGAQPTLHQMALTLDVQGELGLH